jgi:hypothetical protein
MEESPMTTASMIDNVVGRSGYSAKAPLPTRAEDTPAEPQDFMVTSGPPQGNSLDGHGQAFLLLGPGSQQAFTRTFNSSQSEAIRFDLKSGEGDPEEELGYQFGHRSSWHDHADGAACATRKPVKPRARATKSAVAPGTPSDDLQQIASSEAQQNENHKLLMQIFADRKKTEIEIWQMMREMQTYTYGVLQSCMVNRAKASSKANQLWLRYLSS